MLSFLRNPDLLIILYCFDEVHLHLYQFHPVYQNHKAPAGDFRSVYEFQRNEGTIKLNKMRGINVCFIPKECGSQWNLLGSNLRFSVALLLSVT